VAPTEKNDDGQSDDQDDPNPFVLLIPTFDLPSTPPTHLPQLSQCGFGKGRFLRAKGQMKGKRNQVAARQTKTKPNEKKEEEEEVRWRSFCALPVVGILG
jgi:hypothetical protein